MHDDELDAYALAYFTETKDITERVYVVFLKCKQPIKI